MNGIQITTNNNYKQNFKDNLLVIFARLNYIKTLRRCLAEVIILFYWILPASATAALNSV